MKTTLDLWCIILVDDEETKEKCPPSYSKESEYIVNGESEQEIMIKKEDPATKKEKTREEILGERKKKEKKEIDKAIYFLFEKDYITEDEAQKYLERIENTMSLLSLIEIKEELYELKKNYFEFLEENTKKPKQK